MAGQEARQGAGGVALLGQWVAQFQQHDVAALLAQPQKPRGVSLNDLRTLVSAHRLGPDMAVPEMTGVPAADADGADAEPLASLGQDAPAMTTDTTRSRRSTDKGEVIAGSFSQPTPKSTWPLQADRTALQERQCLEELFGYHLC